MAQYNIWVLGETDVALSGGAILDGVTQGDGSHLVGETITLTSTAWSPIAIVDTDTDFRDNDGSQRLDGAQAVDGVTYSDGTRVEAEYSFTVTDGTNSYTLVAFNVNNSNPSFGTIEGVAFVGPPGAWPPVGVPLSITAAQEGPNFESSNYVAPICFAAGTHIKTPDGEQKIETLGAGSKVTTLNGRTATVRWMGRKSYNPPTGQGPIRFMRGAIGNHRELVVSPQHRIYLESWKSDLLFGVKGVLVPAKEFVNGHSIVQDIVENVDYVHLLFDRHEILLSEGIATESLYPGPCALSSIDNEALRELFSVFPELQARRHVAPAAARMLDAAEARLMLAA